nr:unnamed protein product [Callosobruchus analis]
MLYQSRNFLSREVKRNICDALMLSKFNFCDTVYGPSIDSINNGRIQVVQNACLRLIWGTSHKLKDTGWLNMS